MTFTAGLAIAFATVLSGQSQPLVQSQPMPQAQSVKEYVTEYFADEPILIAIAECESRFRQYDADGKVLKNPNSTAIGVFQIMASIHANSADTNLGLDVYTLEGNAAYARYLYEQSGTVPWNSSKACWGKTQVKKNLASK